MRVVRNGEHDPAFLDLGFSLPEDLSGINFFAFMRGPDKTTRVRTYDNEWECVHNLLHMTGDIFIRRPGSISFAECQGK